MRNNSHKICERYLSDFEDLIKKWYQESHVEKCSNKIKTNIIHENNLGWVIGDTEFHNIENGVDLAHAISTCSRRAIQ